MADPPAAPAAVPAPGFPAAAGSWRAAPLVSSMLLELDSLCSSVSSLPQAQSGETSGSQDGVGLSLDFHRSIVIIGKSGSGKSALLQAMIAGSHRFRNQFIFFLPQPQRLHFPQCRGLPVLDKPAAWEHFRQTPSLASAMELLSLYPTPSLLARITACFNTVFPTRCVALRMPHFVEVDLHVRFELYDAAAAAVANMPPVNTDPLSVGEREALYVLILLHLIRHHHYREGNDVPHFPWNTFVAATPEVAVVEGLQIPAAGAGNAQLEHRRVTVVIEEPCRDLDLPGRKALWSCVVHSDSPYFLALRAYTHFVITTSSLEFARSPCFRSFFHLVHLGSRIQAHAPLQFVDGVPQLPHVDATGAWHDYWPPEFTLLPVDVYERTHLFLPLNGPSLVSVSAVAELLLAPTPKLYVEGPQDVPVYEALFGSQFEVKHTAGTHSLLPFMEGQAMLKAQVHAQQLFADELFSLGPLAIVDLDQRQQKEVDQLLKQDVHCLTVSSLESLLVCPELLWALYGDGAPPAAGAPVRQPSDLAVGNAMTQFLSCLRMQQWTAALRGALLTSWDSFQRMFEDKSLRWDLQQVVNGHPRNGVEGPVRDMILSNQPNSRVFAPDVHDQASIDYFTVLSCMRGHTWTDRKQDKQAFAAFAQGGAGVNVAADPEEAMRSRVMDKFWEIWRPELAPAQRPKQFQPHVDAVIQLFLSNSSEWRKRQLDTWLLRKPRYVRPPSQEPRQHFRPFTHVDFTNGCGYINLTTTRLQDLVCARTDPSNLAPSAFLLSFARRPNSSKFKVDQRNTWFQHPVTREHFRSNVPAWALPVRWTHWFTAPLPPAVPAPMLASIRAEAYAVLLLWMRQQLLEMEELESKARTVPAQQQTRATLMWCDKGIRMLRLLEMLLGLPGQEGQMGGACAIFRVVMEPCLSIDDTDELARLRALGDDSPSAKPGVSLLWRIMELCLRQLRFAATGRLPGAGNVGDVALPPPLPDHHPLTQCCQYLEVLVQRLLPRPFVFWFLEEVAMVSPRCSRAVFTSSLSHLGYTLHLWPDGAFDWTPFTTHLPSFQQLCKLQNEFFCHCRGHGNSTRWQPSPSDVHLNHVNVAHRPQLPDRLHCAAALFFGLIEALDAAALAPNAHLPAAAQPQDVQNLAVPQGLSIRGRIKTSIHAVVYNNQRLQQWRQVGHHDADGLRAAATMWMAVKRALLRRYPYVAPVGLPLQCDLWEEFAYGSVRYPVTMNGVPQTQRESWLNAVVHLLCAAMVREQATQAEVALDAKWTGSGTCATSALSKFLQQVEHSVQQLPWPGHAQFQLPQRYEQLRDQHIGDLCLATRWVLNVLVKLQRVRSHEVVLLQCVLKILCQHHDAVTHGFQPDWGLRRLRTSANKYMGMLFSAGADAIARRQAGAFEWVDQDYLIRSLHELAPNLYKWTKQTILQNPNDERRARSLLEAHFYQPCLNFLQAAGVDLQQPQWQFLSLPPLLPPPAPAPLPPQNLPNPAPATPPNVVNIIETMRRYFQPPDLLTMIPLMQPAGMAAREQALALAQAEAQAQAAQAGGNPDDDDAHFEGAAGFLFD